jgi:hypothetical protein
MIVQPAKANALRRAVIGRQPKGNAAPDWV